MTTFMQMDGIFQYDLLAIYFGDVFDIKNEWSNYKLMEK